MSMYRTPAERRAEEAANDAWLASWADRRPAPESPAPTQPLFIRDGDLLLIGRQGAVDEKGYVELADRFALSGEGWPGS